MSKLKNPVALIIMDGWGIGTANDPNNAVTKGKTPVIDKLFKNYPYAQLACSGEAVGLPDGQMGNSEVGHMNMGAGRVVYQELTRITKAIREKTFFANPVFLDVMAQVKKSGGALHLMGLLSDGGVHSHQQHLYALIELAKESGIENVYVHAFLDGRDVPPSSAAGYLSQLEDKLREIGTGSIATIAGRYYAMDRDKRWDRVEKAYKAVAKAQGNKAENAADAINASYADEKTDEFVIPTVIGTYQGMKDGDGAVFFNFRPDRARELTHAFTDENFDGFDRGSKVKLSFAIMTQYEKGINAQIAYKPEKLTNTLGEVICSNGYKQLRIAETEKYAHVTFFFNGGVEQPLEGEDRILVPSPKVATYDLQPEMSAGEVTDKVVDAIKSEKYDFIILNYANGDMVGHTGILPAAVKAVETVDTCVGRFVDAIKSVGGTVCITADHGNAEKMFDAKTNEPFTAHTTNPVPFIVVSDKIKNVRDGALCDIAPTLLKLADVSIPQEMTGTPLID
ncbi:2,3-bisphosphoglycerate-independent phosphoglycerate mutase [Pectinatus haikarae]|uniref:2,3-bisphosphoglycerate-independent phosphoglycerate mutase n=1 Tax=Pectinatus haikarae TaxID=349096 RepID=A0ABT9Y4N4_9FIRM|nr:2,3-bisphosphoglycerate-independent phosphoglycerate mutase [Pectinatus haikarae]MDQ0202704.1 2,3-bisphosphoglycerate-independent phosphoglycerate mutase [Pectinatus haikarae]